MVKNNTLTIGSDNNCDIQIEGSSISRKHLQIERLNRNSFKIKDLNSFGGTFFQGERISESVVQLNDVIQLGHKPVPIQKLAAYFATNTIFEDDTGAGTVVMQMTSIIIGREEPAQILLNYPIISRSHSELRVTPQGLLIRDLNSSNGTFVNEASIGDWVPLSADDELRLGSFRVPKSMREEWVLLLTKPEEESQTSRLSNGLPSKGTMTIGRNPDSDIVVDDLTVSWQHAKLIIKDGHVEVVDLNSANGSYINGIPIQKSKLLNSDILRVGSVHLTIFSGNILQDANANTKVQVDASKISRTLPNGTCILDEVSLSIYPGEMVALMGPSGAGKTSLLEVLTGKVKPTEGHVLLNGENLQQHFPRLSASIGYVPQEDVVHGDLTVFEELMYAACLRLPPDVPKTIISQHVERLITRIGLAHIRNSIIGNENMRGISGGQRKRVNIAIELLTEPAVLYLDEPTSGLDATSTLEVMNTLRSLADSGKTLIMTIHQPRIEAFRMMDNLILLAKGGKLAYYGPANDEAVEYMSKQSGRECLTAMNPADFIVDSLEHPEAPMSPDQWKAVYLRTRFYANYIAQRLTAGNSDEKDIVYPSRHAPLIRQLVLLIQRYIIRKKRDFGALRVQLLQAIVIGALLAILFRSEGTAFSTLDIPAALEKAPNIIRFLQLDNGVHPTFFLAAASAFWLGCNNVARELVSERSIFLRERRAGLHVLAYLSSIFTVQLCIAVVQMSIIFSFVWAFIQPSSNLFLPLGVILLTSSVGIASGLLISSSSRSEVSAISTVPLLLIPQLLLGGYLKLYGRLELSDLQNFLSDLMPIRWSFEAVTMLEYEAVRKINTDLHSLESTIGFSSSNIMIPLGVLVSMTIGMLLISWIQLKRTQ